MTLGELAKSLTLSKLTILGTQYSYYLQKKKLEKFMIAGLRTSIVVAWITLETLLTSNIYGSHFLLVYYLFKKKLGLTKKPSNIFFIIKF